MRVPSILVAMAVLLGLTAAANPWELSLGVNYRGVGDLELKSGYLNNPAFGQAGIFATGSLVDLGGGTSLLTMVDSVRQSDGVGLAALHTVVLDGDNEGLDSSLGVVFAARRVLGERWGMPWYMSLNAMTFGTDASLSGAIQGRTMYYSAIPGTWGFGGPGTVLVDDKTVGSFADSVYALYDMDLDLEAYSFGVGLGTDVALPFGSLRLEAGPTVTLVDYETDASYAAFWSSDDSAVFGPVQSHDEGLEWNFGFYGDLSFVVDLGEAWGIGFGIRYDYMFDKVGTDIGDIDLSGFSASAKVLYRF